MRVAETGRMTFGDEAGVFLRGDDAGPLIRNLTRVLQKTEASPEAIQDVTNFIALLRDSAPQKMKPFAECLE